MNLRSWLIIFVYHNKIDVNTLLNYMWKKYYIVRCQKFRKNNDHHPWNRVDDEIEDNTVPLKLVKLNEALIALITFTICLMCLSWFLPICFGIIQNTLQYIVFFKIEDNKYINGRWWTSTLVVQHVWMTNDTIHK